MSLNLFDKNIFDTNFSFIKFNFLVVEVLKWKLLKLIIQAISSQYINVYVIAWLKFIRALLHERYV